MKALLSCSIAIALVIFVSCNSNKTIVSVAFIDSLLHNYKPSETEEAIAGDYAFWKEKLNNQPTSISISSRVAGDLIQKFHLYGDILNLQKADSILCALNTKVNGQEAAILRSLSSLSLTRHQFGNARVNAQKALALGGEKYATMLLYEDAVFESGDYALAKKLLDSCRSTNEYGYLFRQSKYKHWEGDLDSSIYYMLQAAEWSGSSVKLKQVALSNTGDLYMHEGELEKAYDMYIQSIRLDASDYHSLQSIGRIALLHDNNTSLAQRIFEFTGAHTKLPDYLLYMSWVADKKKDSMGETSFATRFVNVVTDSSYGNMYNKYLIEVYSHPLYNPMNALAIAEKEISNRATPQSYAWYVWCLHLNKQDDEAIKVYGQHVSGKPLEALELYWMGKVMKDLGKGYNAAEYFKAAERNKYDLDPSQMKDLEMQLE